MKDIGRQTVLQACQMQVLQAQNETLLSSMQHQLSQNSTNVRPVAVAGRAVGVEDI